MFALRRVSRWVLAEGGGIGRHPGHGLTGMTVVMQHRSVWAALALRQAFLAGFGRPSHRQNVLTG